jgi:hypothetical protein
VPGSSGTPTRSSTTTPGSRPAPNRFVFSPHAAVFRRLGVADGRCFEGRGACDFKRPGVVGVVGCAHGAS